MRRKYWGKGEIACNEQFFLFPQCFQKTLFTDTSKSGLVWERVKSNQKVILFCETRIYRPGACCTKLRTQISCVQILVKLTQEPFLRIVFVLFFRK